MASKATISFQALSLNAPQNWAISRPQRGWADVSAMERWEDQSLAGATMLKRREKIKGNDGILRERESVPGPVSSAILGGVLAPILTDRLQSAPDHHRVAAMKRKSRPGVPHESAVDELVTAQADDERAWTAPVLVRRPKPAAFSLSPAQAAQAAYFARLHHARDLDSWVRRVVQERLDWEQAALAVVKRRLRKPA